MSGGFAIAIAWPETVCRGTGSWYDVPMSILGIRKAGYYKVGHAAVVLVNPQSQLCHYYDFGRYLTPIGMGRVRSAKSDHNLKIISKATVSTCGTHITNISEILTELNANPSTHGEGTLVASVTPVDFERSSAFAHRLQSQNFIAYGPFIYSGTNCSRFVNKVILAGSTSRKTRNSLRFPPRLTPTPLWNVQALGQTVKLMKSSSGDARKKNWTPPRGALYLDGIGSGSWFEFRAIAQSKCTVRRYSSMGDLECEGFFSSDIDCLEGATPSHVLYPSDCQRVRVKFKDNVVVNLTRIH
mgnify:FL=1